MANPRTRPRDDAPDAVFHVTARVNWRTFHLRPDRCAEIYLRELSLAARRYGMDVITYVLMSNHFHAVVRSPDRERFRTETGRTRRNRQYCPYPQGHQKSSVLSQCFGRVMRLVARKVLEELELRGHLWEAPFHSRRIHDGLDLLITVAYDHINPVRQNMVQLAEDFARSGAAYWAGTGLSALPLATRGVPFGMEESEFRRELLLYQRSEEFSDLMSELERARRDRAADTDWEDLYERLGSIGLDSSTIGVADPHIG